MARAAIGPAGARRIPPAGLAAITAGCFFVLYALRLCPTLCLIGDSAELVTASAIWGVPHPPGYPLFTAIGRAFASIPLGSVPWRVHLTSAVFHAATVGAVVQATFAITRSRVASVAAGWALGFSRAFFVASLYAEVFPLNDLFFACLLALAASDRARRGATGALVAFAAVAGLALGHHPMIVLAAPALAVPMARPLAKAAGTRRAVWLLAALAGPPAALYALVPLAAARSPYLSWGDVHDLRSLLSLMARSDYGGPLSAARGAHVASSFPRLCAFGALLAHSAGAAVLAGAALGVADRLRRRPAVGACLLLAVAVPGPLFAWANALGTRSEEELAYFQRFTSMCHVPLAIAFGAGVGALWARTRATPRTRAAAAAALAAWMAWTVVRTRDVDLRSDRRAAAFAHDLVLSTPERSLILLSGDEPAGAALYVCAVEGACGDRVVLSPGTLFLPWKLTQFRRRHPEIEIPWSGARPALARIHEIVEAEAPKRPVFVMPDLLLKDRLLTRSAHLPDGLLFRIWPAGSDPAAERAAFLASARALARAECEGCGASPRVEPSPSQEVEIVSFYEAAFVNHARTARALGASADLSRALEARAQAMSAAIAAHGGGASTSR